MGSSSSLGAILERRVSALREHLPAALEGDVVGVHQARVASRRLRELLPMLAVADTKGRARKTRLGIRRVTRVLGPVREADVALGHLEEHLEAHPQDAGDISHVQAWLDELRHQRRRALAAEFDERGLAKLWRQLEGLSQGAEQAATATTTWRGVLARRIRDRGDALGDEVQHAGVMYSADALHAVRIATKKLRYAMELAGELRLAPVAAPLKRLKAEQDLLGDIHDLEVLSAFADRAGVTATARAGGARLVGGWQRRCRELHSQYVRSRVALLRLADRATGVVTPRVSGQPVAARS